jgi:glycosyltransferase involved in cell wall biosynthesis
MIFSVIVPFLDEEAYIGRCLAALENQDIPREDYEIIAVDNGSRDGSAAIVRDFPDITLVHHPVPNVYAARNQALRMARGRIIALTDADCEVSRGWLRAIRSGLEGSDASVALGKTQFPKDVSPDLRLFASYENAKIESLCANGPKEHLFASANNMAVKAEAFSRLGPFDEREVASDIEFVQTYLRADPAARVVQLPEMQVVHLEVRTLGTWFRKMRAYGRLIARTPGYRPLPARIRLRMFRRVCEEEGLEFPKRLRFLFWLVVGNVHFALGGRKGRR